MYTIALMVSLGQGCNGGGFQGAPQSYFPPPQVFTYRQFPQLPVFENYNAYNFQGMQFQSGFNAGGYASPAWSPWSSGPPAWSPPRFQVQRSFGVQLFGRPLVGFQGYRSAGFSPQFCPQ